VDWRLPEGASVPVNVTRGDIRVTNEVGIRGMVQIRQPANDPLRTVLVGHEENASNANEGVFVGISRTGGRGVPVVMLAPKQ
jgi:hypothetical protein